MFDNTFQSLEKGMTQVVKNQTVITHNIANAKTPGFEALKFDEELDKAVKRLDKKEVVLEEEMADLNKNATRYSAYVKLMSSHISRWKTIVSQGRK